MKGTFFHQPLEFSLDITGEAWQQGETVKGNLIVKNHGNEEVDLTAMGVTLALTEARKFKAKNEKAFTVEGTNSFPAGTKLSPASEQSLEWSFPLSSDCPISEKSSSLFIYCGSHSNLFDGGHLELKIDPIEVLSKYIEIFENFFRFKTKKLKNKNGFIDVTYTCPGGKDLGQIEKLNQHLRIVDGKLEIKWLFVLNKLGYKDGNVVEEKEDTLFEQLLESKQYKIFGDSPNQDGIISSINEVLDQAKKKDIF
jgi:hypothetical protein